MEQRILGATEAPVSTVGIGTWQLGADWGDVTEDEARAVLRTALDAGVTFIDTADVYGDGRSESIIGGLLHDEPRPGVFVATKMGRRVEQVPENYTRDAFLQWNDRSRRNLQVDTLDLVQLHCPPSATLEDPRTWEALREMRDEGRIRDFGASVETCAQAITAMENGAATIQIILNIFRQKPLDRVLPMAQERGVGIIVRVPLASGLLSGKYRHDTRFAANDHRNYNRDGSAFDVGETFAGVPFDVGVDAAQEYSRLCAEMGPRHVDGSPATPAQIALRWIIDRPGVSTVIPGARNHEQAQANAAAADVEPLSEEFTAALAALYDERIRPLVHDRW